jgi:hypothetical protein
VTRTYTATIAHFFCGSGGGGLGSAEARAQLGGVAARFRQIVEPFAGSAGYALRYPDLEVLLVERDERVAAVWRWLLQVTPDEVLALPDVPPGVTVDDLGLEGPARWFVGFHLNPGQTVPARQRSKWRTVWAHKGWHAGIRKTVADQLRNIRHWRLIQDSYEQASEVVAGPATWFVDPPYEGRAGRAYRGTRLDYDDLARWVEGLRGQVIVCEAAGADWLPFTPIWQTRGIKGRSREAVYVRYSEARP